MHRSTVWYALFGRYPSRKKSLRNREKQRARSVRFSSRPLAQKLLAVLLIHQPPDMRPLLFRVTNGSREVRRCALHSTVGGYSADNEVTPQSRRSTNVNDTFQVANSILRTTGKTSSAYEESLVLYHRVVVACDSRLGTPGQRMRTDSDRISRCWVAVLLTDSAPARKCASHDSRFTILSRVWAGRQLLLPRGPLSVRGGRHKLEDRHRRPWSYRWRETLARGSLETLARSFRKCWGDHRTRAAAAAAENAAKSSKSNASHFAPPAELVQDSDAWGPCQRKMEKGKKPLRNAVKGQRSEDGQERARAARY